MAKLSDVFSGGDEEEFVPVDSVEEDEDVIVWDFSKVGVVPPKGNYVVEIKSAAPKLSQAGNKMLVLGMEIVHPEEYSGVFIYANLMKEGPGINRSKKALEAIFGEVPTSPLRAEDYGARQLWVELGIQKGTGGYEDRSVVNKWLKPFEGDV